MIRRNQSIHAHVSRDLLERLLENLVVGPSLDEGCLGVGVVVRRMVGGEDEGETEASDDGGDVGSIGVLEGGKMKAGQRRLKKETSEKGLTAFDELSL